MDNNAHQTDKLTPEQINKEKQQQDAASEDMKTRCKICFRETSPRRQCGGHGGGGGGGGGESSDPSARNDTSNASQANSTIRGPASSIPHEILEGGWDKEAAAEFEIDEESFNPEVIADLLERNLISIDNDRELETLTIKLRFNPENLTQEENDQFTKFVNSIVKQLEAFKEENGIAASCKKIELNNKGNILSLRVVLPTTKLYDAFIQRLATNLLPAPHFNRDQQTKPEHQQSINPLNVHPLSTKPTLSGAKKMNFAAEEKRQKAIDLKINAKANKGDSEETSFNPSPFSTTPKPTGWK